MYLYILHEMCKCSALVVAVDINSPTVVWKQLCLVVPVLRRMLIDVGKQTREPVVYIVIIKSLTIDMW